MAWDSGDLYEGSAGLASTASASSELSGTYPATKAFDGIAAVDADNCWISDSADPPSSSGSCYLELALGQEFVVGGIQLQRRDTAATGNFPSSIRVLLSETGAFSGEEINAGTYAVNSAVDGAWSDEIDLTRANFANYVRIEILAKWDRGVAEDWVAVKEVRLLAFAVNVITYFNEWQLDADITTEVSGTPNDYGYLGIDGTGTRQVKWKEHRYNASYSSGLVVSKPESAKIRLSAVGPSSVHTGYLFAVYDPTDIDGKYISYTLTKTGYENITDYKLAVLVYDGRYEQSSSTDFPNGAALATKGAGLLQTVYSDHNNVADLTETVLLDTSGATLSEVTVFIKLVDAGNGVSVAADISDVYICDVPISRKEAEIEVPLPSLIAGTGEYEFSAELEVVTPSISASSSFVTMTAELEVVTPSMRVLGLDVSPAAEMEVILPDVEGWMHPSRNGSAQITVAKIEANTGDRLNAEVPVVQFSGTFVNGATFTGNMRLVVPFVFGRRGAVLSKEIPSPDMEGEEKRLIAFNGEAKLPLPFIESRTGTRASVAELQLVTPSLTGNFASVSPSFLLRRLPVPQLDSALSQFFVRTALLQVPVPALVAVMNYSYTGDNEIELAIPGITGKLDVPKKAADFLRFYRGY